MEKTLKIDTITLKLNYLFSTYYHSQIDNYLTDQAPMYAIACEVVDTLVLPKDKPLRTSPNQTLYETDEGYALYVDYQGKLAHRLSINHAKTTYRLTLLRDAYENLAEAEYVITGMIFFDIAYRHKLISLHASAVVVEGGVVLLSGPSGTGKSTLAKRLVEVANGMILNDDKPLLSYQKEEVVVLSSPWSGSLGLNRNARVPLKQILFLRQATSNYFKAMDKKEKLIELMRNIYRPKSHDQLDIAQENFEHLLLHVPMRRYYCTNSMEAANVLLEDLKND